MADGHFSTGTSFDLAEALKGAIPGVVAKALGTEPYLTKWFPEDYRAPDVPRGYRPGERMLHGCADIYNLDLLIAYQSDREVEAAPDDLAGLSWDELASLHSSWLNRTFRRHDAFTAAFGARVCAERATRPEYRATFGRAA